MDAKDEPQQGAEDAPPLQVWAWTEQEDSMLLEHVRLHGTRKWKELVDSGRLHQRSTKACCNRFRRLKEAHLESLAAARPGCPQPPSGTHLTPHLEALLGQLSAEAGGSPEASLWALEDRLASRKLQGHQSLGGGNASPWTFSGQQNSYSAGFDIATVPAYSGGGGRGSSSHSLVSHNFSHPMTAAQNALARATQIAALDGLGGHELDSAPVPQWRQPATSAFPQEAGILERFMHQMNRAAVAQCFQRESLASAFEEVARGAGRQLLQEDIVDELQLQQIDHERAMMMRNGDHERAMMTRNGDQERAMMMCNGDHERAMMTRNGDMSGGRGHEQKPAAFQPFHHAGPEASPHQGASSQGGHSAELEEWHWSAASANRGLSGGGGDSGFHASTGGEEGLPASAVTTPSSECPLMAQLLSLEREQQQKASESSGLPITDGHLAQLQSEWDYMREQHIRRASSIEGGGGYVAWPTSNAAHMATTTGDFPATLSPQHQHHLTSPSGFDNKPLQASPWPNQGPSRPSVLAPAAASSLANQTNQTTQTSQTNLTSLSQMFGAHDHPLTPSLCFPKSQSLEAPHSSVSGHSQAQGQGFLPGGAPGTSKHLRPYASAPTSTHHSGSRPAGAASGATQQLVGHQAGAALLDNDRAFKTSTRSAARALEGWSASELQESMDGLIAASQGSDDLHGFFLAHRDSFMGDKESLSMGQRESLSMGEKESPSGPMGAQSGSPLGCGTQLGCEAAGDSSARAWPGAYKGSRAYLPSAASAGPARGAASAGAVPGVGALHEELDCQAVLSPGQLLRQKRKLSLWGVSTSDGVLLESPAKHRDSPGRTTPGSVSPVRGMGQTQHQQQQQSCGQAQPQQPQLHQQQLQQHQQWSCGQAQLQQLQQQEHVQRGSACRPPLSLNPGGGSSARNNPREAAASPLSPDDVVMLSQEGWQHQKGETQQATVRNSEDRAEECSSGLGCSQVQPKRSVSVGLDAQDHVGLPRRPRGSSALAGGYAAKPKVTSYSELIRLQNPGV